MHVRGENLKFSTTRVRSGRTVAHGDFIGFENANSNLKRFAQIRLGFEGFGIRYIRFTPKQKSC